METFSDDKKETYWEKFYGQKGIVSFLWLQKNLAKNVSWSHPQANSDL
jgi:hypothetical protein